MDSYLDTSFLIKPYVFERESAETVLWVQQHWGKIVVSELSDVEMTTALLRTFAHSMLAAQRAIDAYREDCHKGMYRRVSMDSEVFFRAEMVAEQYSVRFKLRSLDILHLATAIRYGVVTFGVYDKRLSTAAEALGLKVVPTRS